jgi:hypothetical protein
MIIYKEWKNQDIHFNHKHITKENGSETKEMEKEKWFGLMVHLMKEIGKITEYLKNPKI